jgi:SAM-dependent methyltransferase
MTRSILRRIFRKIGFDIVPSHEAWYHSSFTPREEFSHLRFAGAAMQVLLDEFEFSSVLDIGSGEGDHARMFVDKGKNVTAVDLGSSVYYQQGSHDGVEILHGDFNSIHLQNEFDCVWASHVLEHQLNVHSFLLKVHSVLREGGILAITVPPLKPEIVGGHVSLWNAGLLLYRLVLAGFDCRDARVLKYGYNISVIVKKKSFTLPQLDFDAGDIARLKEYFPPGFDEGANGEIEWL